MGNISGIEISAIRELLSDTPHGIGNDGINVNVSKCEQGLKIHKSENGYSLSFNTRTDLMRAVGHLIENEFIDDNTSNEINIIESPRYSMLGVTLDNSRNAVMKVSSIKRMCRILARMGYNSMFLYTEDTFEMKEYPYFGYMRGRFTEEELKECDEYADFLGIELIPCIQTLAHFTAIFRWQEFKEINDCTDILLADDDKTYKFIETMIKTLSRCFKSRRINIGMDEAHMLGLGKYLSRNGYVKSTEIMQKHLECVIKICEKYKFRPMMWSDMFFRMTSSDGGYYTEEDNITDDIVKNVPKNVELIYWDYTHIDEESYNTMFEKHKKFNNETIFAGSAWIWSGIVPINKFSITAAKAAIKSIAKNNIKQVIVTSWGDNGGICSRFTALATFQLYAESCYNENICDERFAESCYNENACDEKFAESCYNKNICDEKFSENCYNKNACDEKLKRRFTACTNGNFDDFLIMDELNYPPDRSDNAEFAINPSRYLMFQDILSGIFDKHIVKGTNEFYTELKSKMADAISRNVEYSIIFETLQTLCDMLSVKSEIGIILKKAYDKKDKKQLEEIKTKILPELLHKIEVFYIKVRKQWFDENKAFGFDVQDIRFGGLIMRVNQAIYMLDEYLSGKIDVIEELEVKRLYADCREENSNQERVTYNNEWSEIATVNVL